MLGSLGKVTIAAGGTPVRITLNASAKQQENLPAVSVEVLPVPANAGPLYIGLKGMNTSSGVNVLAVIPKPASATTGPFAGWKAELATIPGGLQLTDLYIDGTTNDAAFVNYTAN